MLEGRVGFRGVGGRWRGEWALEEWMGVRGGCQITLG